MCVTTIVSKCWRIIFTVFYSIGKHFRFGFGQAVFSRKGTIEMGGGEMQWCVKAGRGLLCCPGKGMVKVFWEE